jgi:hypothetical protein
MKRPDSADSVLLTITEDISPNMFDHSTFGPGVAHHPNG